MLKGVHFSCLGVHFGGANQEKKMLENGGISTKKVPLKYKNMCFYTLYVQQYLIYDRYNALIYSILFALLL